MVAYKVLSTSSSSDHSILCHSGSQHRDLLPVLWKHQVSMFPSQERLTSIVVLCLVAQSCLTLWDPMDCSPPGSSVHGNSPSKSIGMGCHALLQGFFPNSGIEPRSPTLQVDSLTSDPPGQPWTNCPLHLKYSFLLLSCNLLLLYHHIPSFTSPSSKRLPWPVWFQTYAPQE